MPLINRNDLRYDYTWSSAPGNNPVTDPGAGEKPKSMFRRNEGDEVLALINEYVEKNKIENKDEALEVEKLLREKLGNEDKTREEVKVWIDDMMNNH